MFGKLFILMTLIGLSIASNSGNSSGGNSGNPNCKIVDATVTTCVGATGPSCSNSTYLMSLVQAGASTTPICKRALGVPRIARIYLEVGFEGCKRCSCFLASISETRTCAELVADTTFVKNGCKNQSALNALAMDPANAETARICVVNRVGSVIQSATVNIYASLED